MAPVSNPYTLEERTMNKKLIVLVMGIYLGLSLFTSLIMNLYNRRVQVEER